MSIDKSAGVKDRKCKMFPTAGSSYTATVLYRHPEGLAMDAHHARSLKALIRRGLAEEIPDPCIPWRKSARLTAVGRAAADSSPAVHAWLEGWDYYGRRN